MSADLEFQNAIETLLGRLSERMQAEIRSTVSEIVAKAKTDRQTAVDAARAEAAGELERLRAQSEAAIARATANAARERDEAIAKVREQAEGALVSSLAEAQSDAAETAKVAARTEAEQAVASEINQARAEAKKGELAALAAVSRLLDSVRRIDAEPSLSAVLDTLTELMAAEAGRVALFVVQDGRVRGWRFAGFGPEAGEARTLVLDSEAGGFLSRVLDERCAVVLPAGMRSDAVGQPPSFAKLPETGQALGVPVLIGGEAMVLVYADDVHTKDRTLLSQWCEAVELLARHAGHHLEALTADRAARFASGLVGAGGSTPTPPDASTASTLASTTSPPALSPAAVAAPEMPTPAPATAGADSESEEAARRYARLLVSEIKLYNETAVNEGRAEKNLAERLRSEIDRARSLYEQRIPDTVRSRFLFFEQELVRTLADGDPSLLGI